uniref:ORF44b n=1 Tax=Pinus koraiensis TaxID=88728 RepID=Q85X60_PINKO|nr:ORF44b [Pinus koraiensis]
MNNPQRLPRNLVISPVQFSKLSFRFIDIELFKRASDNCSTLGRP